MLTACDKCKSTQQFVSQTLTAERFVAIHKKYQKAELKLDQAVLAQRDAEIESLQAQLAAKDTQIDLYLLQWAHSVESLSECLDHSPSRQIC
jgi:recombinational DNA repair protein (RecF pathway)